MAKLSLKAAKNRVLALKAIAREMDGDAGKQFVSQLDDMMQDAASLDKEALDAMEKAIKEYKANPPAPRAPTPEETQAAVSNLESGGASSAPPPPPAEPAPAPAKKRTRKPKAEKPAAPASPEPAPAAAVDERVFQPGTKGEFIYVRAAVPGPNGTLVIKKTVVNGATIDEAGNAANEWLRKQGLDPAKDGDNIGAWRVQDLGYEPKVETASGPVNRAQMADAVEANLQGLRKDDPKQWGSTYTAVERNYYDRQNAQRSTGNGGPSRRKSRSREANQESAVEFGGAQGQTILGETEAADAAASARKSAVSLKRQELDVLTRAHPENWRAFQKAQNFKGDDAEKYLNDWAARLTANPEDLTMDANDALERASKQFKNGNFEQAHATIRRVSPNPVSDVVRKRGKGRSLEDTYGKPVSNKWTDPKELIDSPEWRQTTTMEGEPQRWAQRELRVKYLAENGHFDLNEVQEGGRARILDLIEDPKKWAEVRKSGPAMAALERWGTGAAVVSGSGSKAEQYRSTVLTPLDVALKNYLTGEKPDFESEILGVEGRIKESSNNPFNSDGSLKNQYLTVSGEQKKLAAKARSGQRFEKQAMLQELQNKGVTLEQAVARRDAAKKALDKARLQGATDQQVSKLVATYTTAERNFGLLQEHAIKTGTAKLEAAQAQAPEGGGAVAVKQGVKETSYQLEGQIRALKRDLTAAKKNQGAHLGKNRGRVQLSPEKAEAEVISLQRQIKEAEAKLAAMQIPTENAAPVAETAVNEALGSAPATVESLAKPAATAVEAAAPTAAAATASKLPRLAGKWKANPQRAEAGVKAAIKQRMEQMPKTVASVRNAAAEKGAGIGGLRGLGKGAMSWLGPLFAIYGVYETLKMVHEGTIGEADQQRLDTMAALSEVSGGMAQDQQYKDMLRSMQRVNDLAAVQRQSQQDQMGSQYTGNEALDALIRGHQSNLSMIAQPSRPSVAEMMARM